MDIYEIVTKLVGRINPVGEANIDNERFENLKVMCELVEKLVVDIDTVGYSNKNAYEFSKKRAAEYSKKFITERLGISDDITEQAFFASTPNNIYVPQTPINY